MANLEEFQHLKERNNDLAQQLQFWKMTAQQRENEKRAITKENNELRLKLCRFQNRVKDQAKNLDTAIQTASKSLLGHLLNASQDTAQIVELTKAYMKDRQDVEATPPQWNAINGSTATEKIHRVPPMMVGGRSIQPVVALRRTVFNNSDFGSSIGENSFLTVRRSVPLRMLQDAYVPLTRIDAADRQAVNSNGDSDRDNSEDTDDDLNHEDNEEDPIENVTQNMSQMEPYIEPAVLDVIIEDAETEEQVTPPRTSNENPMEGPSWLLDVPMQQKKNGANLEPDSTTGVDGIAYPSASAVLAAQNNTRYENKLLSPHVFTPTVRRRKRTNVLTPPIAVQSPLEQQSSPRPVGARKISQNGRVLKVLVAKMQLDSSDENEPEAFPPAKNARGSGDAVARPGGVFLSPKITVAEAAAFTGAINYTPIDAPSPNGATDARVIVSDTENTRRPKQSTLVTKEKTSSDSSVDGASHETNTRFAKRERRAQKSRNKQTDSSSDSRDSDDTCEGRTRRNRKPVIYKEKPLNVKLRR